MHAHYGRSFYSSRDSQTRYAADTIGALVMEHIHAASAIDVGCGVGTWLKAFSDLGLEDILGIEGDWVREESIVIPSSKLLRSDIASPIHLPRSFDLAISLEVAEHIDECDSDQYLDNLTALAPVILFSAAIPLQGGAHHVNEQWPEYWRKKFVQRNFAVVDCIRPKVWNDERIAVWYAQNTFLYVRNDALERFPALVPFRDGDAIFSAVHPRFYEFKLSTWPVMKALRNRLKRFIQ